MQKVIEGWIPDEHSLDGILRENGKYADEGLFAGKQQCLESYDNAKKVRITIIVEDIGKEGGA